MEQYAGKGVLAIGVGGDSEMGGELIGEILPCIIVILHNGYPLLGCPSPRGGVLLLVGT